MRLESNSDPATKDKEYNLSLGVAKKIASEFKLEAATVNDRVCVLLPKDVTMRSIEDEQQGFDTYFEESTGVVYNSMPSIPLPFKVVLDGEEKRIEMYPLTKEYSLVHERGLLNLHRSLRFFLNEIMLDALHFSSKQMQIEHPLNFK